MKSYKGWVDSIIDLYLAAAAHLFIIFFSVKTWDVVGKGRMQKTVKI